MKKLLGATDEYYALSDADKCLVFRYLYYVKDKSVINDQEYDLMEYIAIANEPNKEHLIFLPGSCIETDYPRDIVNIAEEMYDNIIDIEKLFK